jgi:hypothetical protein
MIVPGWPLWGGMAGAVALVVWRVLRSTAPLFEAAAFTALALWLAPSPSPNAVAIPVLLLLLAALRDAREFRV